MEEYLHASPLLDWPQRTSADCKPRHKLASLALIAVETGDGCRCFERIPDLLTLVMFMLFSHSWVVKIECGERAMGHKLQE